MLDRKVRYLKLKKAVMGSDLVMHAYIPERNVVLTKFYRSLVNSVNGIINKVL